MLHKTVCQIKLMPLVRTLHLKGKPNDWKERDKLHGTAVDTPSQALIAVQTSTATGQHENKWDSVSSTNIQNTQQGVEGGANKPRLIKFIRVDNLCNNT
jgi:hypothetical protein